MTMPMPGMSHSDMPMPDPPDTPPFAYESFVGSSVVEADEASVAANMDAMMTRVEERQAQSAAFIVEHGAAVVGGHSPVGVVLPTAATPMTGDVFDPAAD